MTRQRHQPEHKDELVGSNKDGSTPAIKHQRAVCVLMSRAALLLPTRSLSQSFHPRHLQQELPKVPVGQQGTEKEAQKYHCISHAAHHNSRWQHAKGKKHG
jgi:hypothetical protein